MKQCITIAMLVFSTLSPLIGQNADAVKAYLGAYRYDNVAPPAGPVEFVFSRTTLNRQADGKATYKALLKQGYFQDGGNYGTLSGVRITENGKLVPVERYTPAVDPSGPLTRADVGGSALKVPSMPDSAAMVQGLDNLKKSLGEGGAEVAKAARPLWGFCMWVFYGALPFLLGIGLVLYFVSGLAADEVLTTFRGFVIAGNSLRFTHSWSSFLLYWDLVIICVMFIGNSIFFMWELTHSCWVFLPLFIFVHWLRKRAARVIPNISVAGSQNDQYTKDTPLLAKGK